MESYGKMWIVLAKDSLIIIFDWHTWAILCMAGIIAFSLSCLTKDVHGKY
jgi:hypothetical protein